MKTPSSSILSVTTAALLGVVGLQIHADIISFDTDLMTITVDGVGSTSINGSSLASTGLNGPISEFFFFGDLTFNSTDVINVTGDNALSIIAGNNLFVSNGAVFNLAGAISTPGAGGGMGFGGTSGGSGGNGGSGGSGGGVSGAGGTGGDGRDFTFHEFADSGSRGNNGSNGRGGSTGSNGSTGNAGGSGVNGGVGGAGGSGGSRGALAGTGGSGANGGSGGQRSLSAGASGANGSPGGIGNVGGNGSNGNSGQNGSGGSNAVTGLVLSGGGAGGAGGGGGGGAGGGGGGGGGHGGGGAGGAGNEAGNGLGGIRGLGGSAGLSSLGGNGGAGSNGGNASNGAGGGGGGGGGGGAGGDGGDGSRGGVGGVGGGGGGAIGLGARGVVVFEGAANVSGGNGSSGGTASNNTGEQGGAGGSGGTGGSSTSGTGGRGGLGGLGGLGGTGGAGGRGGTGGGGAGGSVVLDGSLVQVAATANINASGGQGSSSSNDGQDGRFVVAGPNTSIDGGATISAQLEQFTGSSFSAVNPYSEQAFSTSLIHSVLSTGAEGFGLSNLDAAAFASVLTDAPSDALAAVFVTEGGDFGLPDIAGFDYLVFANISGDAIDNPELAFGGTELEVADAVALMGGGFETLAEFGGSGPVVIDTLTDGSVYLSLIPESSTRGAAVPLERIAVSATADGMSATLLSAFPLEQLLYLTTDVSLVGDANGDNFVGIEDLDILLANWGDNVGGASAGDLSGDGLVDQVDLQLVLDNWGTGTPSGGNVPEPGTLAGLAFLLFCTSRRRR